MAKIVELVQAGKYDELKDVLEEKLATKIAQKIEEKKINFIEAVKKGKLQKKKCSTSSSSTSTKTKGE